MSSEDSIVRKSILYCSIGCRRRRGFTRAAPVLAIAMWLFALGPAFGAEDSDPDSDAQFSLLQGKGVPVCEAYLELLNKTKFEVTPFCGRPADGDVKGFERLERHYLGEPEITPLYTYVWEFMRFNDQHHVEKFCYPNIVPAKAHCSAAATTGDEIPLLLRLGRMRVWTYTIPLDINNNGSPLKVLIWQGLGTGKRCGDDYYPTPWTDSYVHQRAFVLSADGTTIDEALTRSIFGALSDRRRSRDIAQLPEGTLPAGANPFQPVADSIGIFEYDGRYYIETEDQPESKNAPLPPVRVLLREHGTSNQVCALRPQSVPSPAD
jgi:hypothetical protein